MNLARRILLLAPVVFCARCADVVHRTPDGATDVASPDATVDADAPSVDVAPPRDAVTTIAVERNTVAAGSHHACAIDREGAAWCWGDNTYGQLGDGTTTSRTSAARVAGLTGAASIFAGEATTCVILRDRTVQCWGLAPPHDLGEMPPSPDLFSPVPRAIAGLDDAVSIGIGAGLHGGVNCAANGDTLWCWGQLGMFEGLPMGTRVGYALNTFITNGASQFVTNGAYRCVTIRDGQHGCWGSRLWNGWMDVQTPTPIPDVRNVREMAVGSLHVCALSRMGWVWCIGDNAFGELGDGTTRDESRVIVYVAGAPDTVALSAGGYSMVALRNDGTVRIWGRSLTATSAPFALRTPTLVAGLSNIVDIAAGSEGSACARRADGAVFCWGDNTYGQLGDGTRNDRVAPVRVLNVGP